MVKVSARIKKLQNVSDLEILSRTIRMKVGGYLLHSGSGARLAFTALASNAVRNEPNAAVSDRYGSDLPKRKDAGVVSGEICTFVPFDSEARHVQLTIVRYIALPIGTDPLPTL